MSRWGRDRNPEERLDSPPPARSRNLIEAEIPTDSRQRTGADHDGRTFEAPIQDRGLERQHSHSLNESDAGILTDIGTFRVLDFEDLVRRRYGGDTVEAGNRLANLSRKGLVRSRTSYPDGTVYVTLTRAGHRLIARKREQENPEQKLYCGFVKTRQAHHDAALYRLYHHEVARIEGMGGRVQRVILNFELMQSINRRLAKLKSLPQAEQTQDKQQVAEAHGLTVVGGKIPLPDLRLEYEGPDQQLAKVDLELVTSNYHHRDLAAKALAGFAMYAFAEEAARLRMQDPEIMQNILSL